MVSERPTKVRTETEGDMNCIGGAVRTRGTPGHHVCKTIGTAEKSIADGNRRKTAQIEEDLELKTVGSGMSYGK